MGFFPKSKKDTYRFDKKVNDKMEKFIAGIQIENVAGTCFTAKFVKSKGKSCLPGKRL